MPPAPLTDEEEKLVGPTVKSKLPYVTADVTGSGWYDHEFGGKEFTALEAEKSAAKSAAKATTTLRKSKAAAKKAAAAAAAKADAADFSAQTVKELKALCKAGGLSTGGRKADLVSRLESSGAGAAAAGIDVSGDAGGDETMRYAWNWAAVQFDDGTELTVALLCNPVTKPPTLMETRAVFIDADGNRHPYEDIVFEAFDEVSFLFIYRYILRESCSQFDSLPLTSLTISPFQAGHVQQYAGQPLW